MFQPAIVFPTYFISRSFLDKKKSLVIVIIACLNPFHLVFPRRILSENLYYLVFMWAMYLVWKKPFNKKAGLLWDIFTGIVLGLLYLTRYISLAVIPMFLIAWWLKPFDKDDSLFKPESTKLVRFLLIILCIVLVFGPWIIRALQEGVPIKSVLGFVITANTNPEQLTITNLLKWLLLYLSYIVIMAAPFLPLLLYSISAIDFEKWRTEYSRWILQTAIITAGFLVAAVRHSWRATYNAESPKILMGRYVLFMAVPFLIQFFFALDLYKHEKSSRNIKRDIYLLVISIGLVLLAYFILIKPEIIKVEDYFVRIETSADAYYIVILGKIFFVFIILLYSMYLLFFANREKKSQLFGIISIVMAGFFIAGWPEYSTLLKANQTNSWLSGQVAKLVREYNPDELEKEEITLFIPKSFENKEKIEIYNGLRVRGFDNTQFLEFTESNVAAMPTNYGAVIQELTEMDMTANPVDGSLEFNNRLFLIDVIIK